MSDAVSDAPPPVDALDAAWSDPKLANVVYHDWEAATYDDKWSISYDDRCIEYARDIFDRLVGDQMLDNSISEMAEAAEPASPDKVPPAG